MSINEAALGLGTRVRELRHERGLTLKALGRRAGLSHPFLSQLERGLARPSVRSVERIAGALDVPVGALWTASRPEAALLVRAGKDTPGVRDVWADGTGLRVRELNGGDRAWPQEAEIAAGVVLLYMVRGAIDIDLDGTVHSLEAGDALRFDGAVPHRLRRRGPVTTRALYVAAA